MMMSLTEGGLLLAGRTVLVRLSLENGVTARMGRLVSALADRGARVAVIAGLGNPAGDINPALSLAVHAGALSAMTGRPVRFIKECVGAVAEAGIAQTGFGEIAVLENLRFHADERRQDRTFAIRLAVLGDYFIDAGEVPAKPSGWQAALKTILPAPDGLDDFMKTLEEV